MKSMNEEIKKVNGAQELDDDMLDGVSGGLVQLVNPSSSRTDNIVLNKRTTFLIREHVLFVDLFTLSQLKATLRF